MNGFFAQELADLDPDLEKSPSHLVQHKKTQRLLQHELIQF